jgi:hypothetical protein
MTTNQSFVTSHPAGLWLATYAARVDYEETTASRVSYIFDTLSIFLLGLVTAFLIGRIPKNCYDYCDVERVVEGKTR